MNILKKISQILTSFLSRVHLGRRVRKTILVLKQVESKLGTIESEPAAKSTATKGLESDPSDKGSGDCHD